ncbi:hypothetical protein EXIGLDRAFT_734314, partial [Exidia glandulosa HHB12029]
MPYNSVRRAGTGGREERRGAVSVVLSRCTGLYRALRRRERAPGKQARGGRADKGRNARTRVATRSDEERLAVLYRALSRSTPATNGPHVGQARRLGAV